MNDTPAPAKARGRLKILGWVLSIVGAALYAYGFFVEGSAAFVDWSLYMPDWAVMFMPNWQAEAGLALSVIGSIPIYYVEIRNLRAA